MLTNAKSKMKIFFNYFIFYILGNTESEQCGYFVYPLCLIATIVLMKLTFVPDQMEQQVPKSN